MKKAIKVLFALILMLLPISGSFAAEKNNKPDIKTVDNYVAIFDFEVTTGDKGISRPLADRVIHVFSQSNKYEVIDRGNMNKILNEQKFQMSGCVAQECRVEAGQILGVGKIVNGSVGIVGKTYYLTLQLIDVKTGKVELSAEDVCKCEIDDLLGSTMKLAKKLLSENVEQPATKVPEPVTIAESKAKADAIAKAKAEAEEIERAKAEAEVIVKSAVPEPKITNSCGMTFVYIKPGTFIMGSPSGLFSGEPERDNDETQHEVTLTRGFYMQTTEVTQEQWQYIMGYNPSYFKSCGDDCPVEQVSWNDVQEFVLRLNQKEGINSYRLPTEAEWEYAARAGTTTPFNTGNCLSTKQANYDGNNPLPGCSKGEFRKTTVRTGIFPPNAWGLYDMHGNVWEWCQDWYSNYPSGNVTDPAGPLSGSNRVNRGGSWGLGARQCRSADRDNYTPELRYFNVGFRLARTPLSEQIGQPAAVAPAPATVTILKQPDLQPTTGETARDGRFIAYSNGTVLDTQTSLMWAGEDNGSKIDWADAKSYCENYRGGGYTDWRMPTQDELAGLYDKAKTYKSDCGYDVHLTELIRLTCTWAWASEKRGSVVVAYFRFGVGERFWIQQSSNYEGRVIPVRSGK